MEKQAVYAYIKSLSILG